MELKGFLMIHIDVDRDVAYDYNRWYDLDHGPEVVWLPGVVGTRRYHATPELIAQRVASDMPELGDGPGELLSLYWFSDDALAKTRERIAEYLGPDGPIAKEGRLFRRDKVRIRNAEVFRRVSIHRGDALDVAEEAVPYFGHLGVYVEVWRGPAELGAWLDAEHAPALIALPPVLGAVHLAGSPDGHADWQVVVGLLGEEPEQVASKLREQLAKPGPPEGCQRLLGGCFNLITPLRYDFTRD